MIEQNLFVKGKQELAIESIKQECWRCKNEIEVFTNILFPAIPINSWEPLNRKYYALIPIDSLTGINSAKSIIDAINTTFYLESDNVCQVQIQSSKGREYPYLANKCRYCNIIQGAFPLSENRFSALRKELEDNLETIFIRRIDVNVDNEIIETALEQTEHCNYSLYQNYLKTNPFKSLFSKIFNRKITT